MWSRCVFTVASEMKSRAAAPAFVSPWEMRRQHLELSVAQRLVLGSPQLADEAGRDRRRKHRLAARGGVDRPDELVARRVLEQVARRARLERRHDVAIGVVGREDEHLRGGSPCSASARMAAAPPRPGIRRSMRMTSGRSDSTSASASAPSDASPTTSRSGSPGEHAAEAVADDGVVVDDHQPDRAHGADAPDDPAAIAGTRAESAVPPPGSDSIASEPATRAMRWRMAVRPKPDPAAGIRLRAR